MLGRVNMKSIFLDIVCGVFLLFINLLLIFIFAIPVLIISLLCLAIFG